MDEATTTTDCQYEYVYRFLPTGEWPRLQPIYEANGYPTTALPRPGLCVVAVCELSGAIVSFLILQLAPHAEPIHIDAGHRGKVNWIRMLHMLEGTMAPESEYFALAPNDRVAGMCEAAGMVNTGWKAFKGKVAWHS